MNNIVPLHGDDHREIQDLLPWFVSGALEPAEAARVEAHFAECPECQADLAVEQRLRAEIAAMPADLDAGWERLHAQLKPGRRGGAVSQRIRLHAGSTIWRPWAVAASLAVVVGTAAVLIPANRPADYHALAAVNPAAAGDIVVMFRPDAPERHLRAILRASGARLVGGPTAADAYVLAAPLAVRATSLRVLRGSPVVTLAEPIDPGAPP